MATDSLSPPGPSVNPAFNVADKQRPPPLTYGCICSGISAPTLAAKPLGWETKFFSEIEPFPRAVLSHHYPDVPLHGDFTTIERNTYGTVDILVGGTPCQSFSVAGKRLGLDDPRGNLALEYIRLAERVDAKWLVFENVPGLLSSAKGDDFAAFISAVTGHDYRTPGKWRNAGIAVGKPGRWGLAWRVLDAQYFGVAQRRRRVFVVASRSGWASAAAVLLEPESMCGNPPPSREKGKAVAALTATGVGTCGADDNQGQAGHLICGTLQAHDANKWGSNQWVDENKMILAFGGNNTTGPIDVATACHAHGGPSGRLDFESETFVTHTLRGEDFDASEDGTGRGTPLVPVAFAQNSRDELRIQNGDGSIAGALSANPGMKQTTYLAFSCKDNGRDATEELAPTLRSMNSSTGHPNGGGQMAICYPILEPGARTGKSTDDPRAGLGVGNQSDPMFTLQAGKQHGIAAFKAGQGAKAGSIGYQMEVSLTLGAADSGSNRTPALHGGSMVRRLTPEECELLQGAPEGYTLIPWRNGKYLGASFEKELQSKGKHLREPAGEMCPDGPRYKAIGNSMAVPCVNWIFTRLDAVHRIIQATRLRLT